MKLLKSKSGKLNNALITTVMLGLVLIVVVFQVYAALMPSAQAGGDTLGPAGRCEDVGCYYNVSETTCQVADANISACEDTVTLIPLGGLFAGTSVVFVIIMAALLIVVIKSVLPKGK